jgi:hypothetical protein
VTVATVCRHGKIHPRTQPCTCPACIQDRRADNRRRNQKPKRRQWQTKAFRQARLMVLNRDHWICYVCGGYANTVDHGNHGLHETHLWRAMCLSCHGAKDGAG